MGPVLRSCPQGLLFHTYTIRACSIELAHVCLIYWRWKGVRRKGSSPPTHTTTWRMSSRNNSTILTALDLAHLSPLPTRTALLCYTCELQGLRYQVSQWVGVRESSLLLWPQGQLLHLPQALMVVEGQLSPSYITACFSPACLFLNTQWPQINRQSHNIL